MQKDFSQKSVFWKRILGPKNDKKLISLKAKEIWKSYFSILEGVILLQLFPIPIPFRDMRFWPF